MPPVEPRPTADLWAFLRTTTRARIGLGRAGDALPLSDVLAFQLAHARARDAVHTPLDVGAIARGLAPRCVLTVMSAAPDRAAYLKRPDLGRRLDPECRAAFAVQQGGEQGNWDVVFVIADGLSPVAVQQHSVPVLHACLARLPGWSIAPVVVATQARVALGDEVGERLGARLCIVFIGERPGLSIPNSLGIYVTYSPRVGRRDSERNCISNIHADGLSYEAAADRLVWLATEATRRKLTGVALKDDRALFSAPEPPKIG